MRDLTAEDSALLEQTLTRRRLLELGIAGCAAITLPNILVACGGAPAASASPKPKDTGQLVISGFGGSYQAAQKTSFYDPFSKESGVTVTGGTSQGIAQAQAEVKGGHPSFDMEDNNLGTQLIGQDANIWMPIDYSFFRKEDLAAIPKNLLTKYGAPTIAFVECMSFNNNVFPASGAQPNSWADFWNVQKFPGKRGMFRPDLQTSPVPEAALLADGVTPAKLYPLDMNRAIRKIQQIQDHVVWFNNQAQPSQAMVNKQVVMAMDANGRDQVLIDQGAPLQIVWNQARLAINVWNVLKGAPNWVDAMKFIAYASRPEGQVTMAKLTGYAPTNTSANNMLDDATKQKMATYPAHLKLTYPKDEVWWYKNRQQWIELALPALGLA